MAFSRAPARPFASSSVAAPDTPRRASKTLAVVGAVFSLTCVVVGFALVALDLVGVVPGAFTWGTASCAGGWATAFAARGRGVGGHGGRSR